MRLEQRRRVHLFMALVCGARAQHNSERPNSVERAHPCGDRKSPGYSKCDFRCQLSLATMQPITSHRTQKTSPTKNR
jgi:hypothetical protein